MESTDRKVKKITLRDNLKRQYIFFIYSFSMLAISALITFGVVNMTTYDRFIGMVEFTIALILIVNLVLLWLTRNARLCAVVLLSGVYCLFLILFVTGGIANTGIFWFFTFPPAAFFLTGRKNAVIWQLLLYGGIISLTVLGEMKYIVLPYSLIQIRQLVIAHVVLSAILYIYENTREVFEYELENSRKELEKEKETLEEAVKQA